MNSRSQQWIPALLLITLLCVPIFLFVISTQPAASLNAGDNPWYLNRAALIWHGVLPDLFVYTLAFPTFIGVIDWLLHDAILSGMLANAATLWLVLVGTYVLGRWLYGSRRVAWLAVLLLATNTSIFATVRLFSPYIPFTAAVIWCVIACLLVIRRPGVGTAALLGAVLALALYTRFEGTVYALLIPLAAWQVYHQRRDRRLALDILLAGGITLALLALPFALNFLQVRQALDSARSTNVTGIFTLLNRTPIEWDVIARRATDEITAMLSHWATLAWLVAIAGVIWASARYRAAQRFAAALVGFNLLYAFLLAIWLYPIYLVYSVPLIALIVAAALDQLARRWRLAVLPLIALIVLPGIIYLSVSAGESLLAYRASDVAQTGAALDGWLDAQGWAQARIYTFCSEITPFSRAPFQIIYRLQFTTGWDAPERLTPLMREQDALLMVCGNWIPYDDWRALLAEGTPPGFHEAGRFDKFIFYRPDDP